MDGNVSVLKVVPGTEGRRVCGRLLEREGDGERRLIIVEWERETASL